MGDVFLCTNINLENKWAVKRISNYKHSKSIIENEQNTLRKLNHPNIPQIVDIYDDGNYTYIVETYIEGFTLQNILKKYEELSEIQIANWCLQLCDALEYLHTFKPLPIIYRDVKPSNIMITKENKLYLVDFGSAILYKKENTSDYFLMGTSMYSAPEQLIVGGISDVRTDIYGLGATIYEMASGSCPESNIQSITGKNFKIRMGLKKIIVKCLDKDKENRYQNIYEMRKDLKSFRNLMIAEIVNEEKVFKRLKIVIVILSIFTYILVLIALLMF